MRRLAILTGLTAALLAPVAARADPPTQTDHQNAAQECRSERGTTTATREAFRAEYGTNHNGRNAFGKCVSTKAERLSQMDRQAAKAQVSAAKRCDAERGTTAESRQAFSDKYGTGRHNRNAFGRCVSALAKAIKDKGAKS